MKLTLDKHGKLHVTEAQLQAACVKLLRLSGWCVRPAPKETYKSNVPRDEPDLLCVKPGRVLWLELKTATGTLSDGQWRWYHEARAEGYEIHVIRSVDELRSIIGVSGGKR